MGPALGLDGAAGFALQAIVADRGGGSERFVDVAGFEQVTALGRVTPDAGEAVGLELEPDGEAAGAFALAARRAMHLVARAELVLQVVTDLVRDHVRLGEVAGGAEATFELGEEAEVDVRTFVARAVEGARCGAAEAAAGRGLVGEE